MPESTGIDYSQFIDEDGNPKREPIIEQIKKLVTTQTEDDWGLSDELRIFVENLLREGTNPIVLLSIFNPRSFNIDAQTYDQIEYQLNIQIDANMVSGPDWLSLIIGYAISKAQVFNQEGLTKKQIRDLLKSFLQKKTELGKKEAIERENESDRGLIRNYQKEIKELRELPSSRFQDDIEQYQARIAVIETMIENRALPASLKKMPKTQNVLDEIMAEL